MNQSPPQDISPFPEHLMLQFLASVFTLGGSLVHTHCIPFCRPAYANPLAWHEVMHLEWSDNEVINWNLWRTYVYSLLWRVGGRITNRSWYEVVNLHIIVWWWHDGGVDYGGYRASVCAHIGGQRCCLVGDVKENGPLKVELKAANLWPILPLFSFNEGSLQGSDLWTNFS